jgi:Zn-dependent alcohol dehydrogenase
LLPSLGIDALITARFPLSEIGDAFAQAAAARGVKTVITPGSQHERDRGGA